MKFEAARADLAAVFGRMKDIPEAKNLSSVMTNVSFETIGTDKIKIRAMSYEVELTETVPARVKEEGKAAVQGRCLFDAIRILPDDPVQFETKPNHWARIRSGSSEVIVPGIAPDNMPDPGKFESNVGVSVAVDTLRGIVSRTMFAASADTGRPNLMGIDFKIADGKIVAAATDGHRLASVTSKIGGKEVFGGILNRVGFPTLSRFLETFKGEIDFDDLPSGFVFRTDTAVLSIRKVDLEYPDWTRVVPSKFAFEWTVNREKFAEVVRAVKSIVHGATFLSLDRSGDMLIVSASDPEHGDARFAIDVEGEPEKEKDRVNLNPIYLSDAIGVLEGETIRICVSGPLTATVVKSDDPKDAGVLTLLMPFATK